MPTRRPGPKLKALPSPTPSEAAFERLLAGIDEPVETPEAGARAFVQSLFANSSRYLKGDRYENLGDSSQFNTKLAGVSFEGRQDIAAGLVPGTALALRRQADNPHDANAIAVFFGALQLGFLNRKMAAKLSPLIDGEGRRYTAEITAITGGKGGRSFGINVLVRRFDVVAPSRIRVASTREGADVRRALIGEHPVREAQSLVIDRVDGGRNTLAIMGTGRGKSFCFQFPAATRALERGEKTLVIYPLRALANDQFDAMERRLGPLGLRILRANGAIDGPERTALMAALESGEWDLICSTPEFVQYHLERFAAGCSRPSFVVVDEAHHLFESKHRPAYGKLPEMLAALGNPQVLALTATATDDAFSHLTRESKIDAWVIDATIRENLHVVDARGTQDKSTYLLDVLREAGKAIVYCNSRSEATKVAERIRRAFGDEVAYYHAGMPSAERAKVEDYFRTSALRIVVATSAFGEGIDLPDVRNVVLYHLNFDFTEFNQQAGRAGRDGAQSSIHLLFTQADRRINDYLIARTAPSLVTLREIYRGIKGLAQDDVVRTSHAEIARILEHDLVGDRTISVALRIFEDAGLITQGEDEDGRFVRFLDVATKVDLTQNARFAEGQAERESFDRFCSLALSAAPEILEKIVNRPIYPQNVTLVR